MTIDTGRYIFPIDTLKVDQPWHVGNVVIYPGSELPGLIASAPARGGAGGSYQKSVDEMVSACRDRSVAVVRAGNLESVDDALDAVRTALDILRLFQSGRSRARTTWFSLPGELYQANIEYLATGATTAVGQMFRGKYSGWSFGSESHREWLASAGYQFLSNAAANPTANEACRRAILSVRLFSRAAAEHRPDLKIVGIVGAMEALLVDHTQSGGKSFALARYVAWFTCHLPDQPACGRDQEMCAAVFIRPEKFKRLKVLRQLGNSSKYWQCHQWRSVCDWYDNRSLAAHGDDPHGVGIGPGDQAEYHFSHYLIEPVLAWFAAHLIDPIGDLQRDIDSRPSPSAWTAVIAAMDRGDLVPPWVN